MSVRASVLFGVAILAFASGVWATLTLPFEAITNNDPANVAIGEAQFFLDVDDDPAGVAFTIRNTGPEPSSIALVHFDDGSLLGLSELVDSDDGIGGDPDVDFSPSSSSNLPGGATADPPFIPSVSFGSDSDPPPVANGIQPGQWLTIIFTLQGTQTSQDVFDELADGTLRVGVHATSIGDSENSESFITPEPISLLLLGLGGVAVTRRRLR